jgi:hypothetical protein
MSEHSGTRAEARAKSSACTPEVSRVPEVSFPCGLCRDQFKSPSYFFEKHRECHGQHGLLGVEHHIYRSLKPCTFQPRCFSQTPLDAIAVNCSAKHATDGESYTRPTFRLPQVEHGHMGGEVAAPLLIYAVEVGMFPQMRRPRELVSPRYLRWFHTPAANIRTHRFTISARLPVADASSHSFWQLGPGNCWTGGTLLAESRLHRDALPSLGPAARQHLGSALGLHSSPEPVLFRALAPVGLKCTFGHEKPLLLIESAA